jgi:Ser/Thr protein kinase RdoA (MazF antagonist)
LSRGHQYLRLTARLASTEHPLALLEFVPGRELEGESDEEQRWIAHTLAGVHRAGSPADGPTTATFMTDWLAKELPGMEAHPWLVQAVEAVRAETDLLRATWSVLRTDPSPEAFRHDDSTGVTGLVDWTGARRGPVLYDVASAVMYLGGPEHAIAFLTGYGIDGPVGKDEMRHLNAFRRFREGHPGRRFRLAVGH